MFPFKLSLHLGVLPKRYLEYIQGVSRLVDITAGGDFLGLCYQNVHISMCPILDGYGVMTA